MCLFIESTHVIFFGNASESAVLRGNYWADYRERLGQNSWIPDYIVSMSHSPLSESKDHFAWDKYLDYRQKACTF